MHTSCYKSGPGLCPHPLWSHFQLTNTQYEKRGREAADLPDEPWDLKILDVIGTTIVKEDVKNIVDITKNTINSFDAKGVDMRLTLNIIDKYPGQSKIKGIQFIKNTLLKLEVDEALNAQDNDSNKQSSIENNLIVISDGQNGFFNRYLKPLFTNNFIFQALIATCLLLTYVYLGRKLLPEPGLNQEFLLSLFKPLVLLSTLLGVIFFINVWLFCSGQFSFSKAKEKFDLKNVYLTALPMTAIIQYIFANQDILKFSSSMSVFLQMWGLAIILIVIIPWLISPILTTNLSIPVSLSFTFIIYNMAGLGRTTSFNTISILLTGTVLIVFLVLYLKKKAIVLFISIAMFIATGATGILGLSNKAVDGDSMNDFNNGPTIQLTQGKKAVKKSDIYILIYDSYANEETLKAYGYDNSKQMEYLLEQDFAIYDGIYSVGDSSLTSTANILNTDPFAGTTENYRKVLSGQGSSLLALKSIGYNLQSVFPNDYYTKGNTSTFDFSYPSDSYSIDPSIIIRNAILEGEFRFDADFSTLTYDDYLDAKKHILNRKPHDLNFYYSHDELPGHSQNSGVLRPDESEIHFGNLDKVNLEMRSNIAAIQAHNKDAIIVVMGDHGPYLTKNGIGLSSYDLSEIDRLDIQDRYGSFLAIKWPEKEYADTHDIQIIQDVMPAILSYIYDDSSFFDKMRMPRETLNKDVIGGASVIDGIINGGSKDKEFLFLQRGIKYK